jgi:hypothetical protein
MPSCSYRDQAALVSEGVDGDHRPRLPGRRVEWVDQLLGDGLIPFAAQRLHPQLDLAHRQLVHAVRGSPQRQH